VEQTQTGIPKSTLIQVLVSLGIILVIIIAGILPYQRYLGKLDQNIKQLQFQIEEHKNLFPLYESLQRRLLTKGSGVLPFPRKAPLPRGQISKVPKTIGEIAGKCGMDAVSVSPDLKGLTKAATSLSLTAVIKGDFFNFRRFLIGLGGVSYLERIEEVHIQQNPDALEFRMKIWITIS
jgi:hypothetical protein